MADRTLTDRLQPSILDRLRDDAPEQLKENQADRVIDLRRLREIIQRDLSWLLNTTNMGSELDREAYPNVARSVLDFGVGDVTGTYSNMRRAELVRDSIARAVETFEPRLIEGSLDIVTRKVDQKRQSIVVFDIVAELWAQPMPVELYLRSEFDVTTGHIDLAVTN
jgi:type VI secretion system protein ImpF